MTTTTITIRIDKDTKSRAESLFNSIGINTSTAITMFLKAAIKENKIPFELKGDDPFYSKENMKHLSLALQRYKEHKGTQHNLIEVEDD